MANDIRHLLRAAFASHESGDLADAEALCGRILASEPRSLDARMLLGVIAAKTDRPAEAERRFREVLEADPRAFMALNWLSKVLREHGRWEEALALGQQALQLRPLDPDVIYNVGLAYVEGRLLDQAISCFDRAIGIRPNHPGYYVSKGVALSRLGLISDAIYAYGKALAIRPDPRVYVQLALLHFNAGSYAEAIAACQKALEKAPDEISARLLMARALAESGEGEAAAAELDIIQEMEPGNSEVHVQRALWLQARGMFAEAHKEFEHAIEVQPNQGTAYYGLVSGTRIGSEDRALVQRMEDVASQELLLGGEAVHLRYALGKAYDNLGEYQKALEQFDQANDLAKSTWLDGKSFDRDRFRSQIDAAIGLFSDNFMNSQWSLSSPSTRPIFIVGMVRSGTTLAEQILSCHREVGGAGELGFWTRAEESIVDYRSGSLDETLMAEAVQSYLDLLARAHPNKSHVTDKNPANLLVLGLIHLAYPDARIIHTRRHPVDTALSIYMTPMRNPPSFACDRSNIVFAYEQYSRLMEHWRKVLPGDRFLEVSYEDVIQDRVATTRRMLDFCGLEWDEACLHPEDNLRTVRTPSFWQVRQPVYSTSLGRWKHYQPWLGDFANLL